MLMSELQAYALAKCIEEGVNHMFTVSAIQMHPKVRVRNGTESRARLHPCCGGHLTEPNP